jgi:Peptidase family M28
MDVERRIEIIRELCSFEGRRAGTDAERRAAERVAERLRKIGRPVEVQPTTVHPQYGYVHAAHCLLGIAGSLIAVEVPALGFALVLLAATSLYLDLDYRIYLIRRLFFRRVSQNVVSCPPAGDRARLIVCAHLDAARSGAVFSPWLARRAAGARRRLPWLGPFRIMFWSLALLLVALGARMAGVDSTAMSALALPPTLVLLVGAFALVEIELSPIVPGANDNASGVATALSIADRLEADPLRHLDLCFVFDGGEEPIQEGMRAFVRSHRDDLDRERTFFLVLDTVGIGEPRFETAAGWVTAYPADRRLVELCAAIAGGGPGAEPLRRGVAGDSMPPRVAGLRSLLLTSATADGYLPHHRLPGDTPATLDPEALERSHEFALELIRRLDRDVGRKTRKAKAPAVAA